MSAPNYDIEINQAADFYLSLIFNDSTGNPLSLADADFEAHVRADFSTKTILEKFTCSKDDTPGRVSLSLASDRTAILDFDSAFYDLVMTKSGVKTRMLQGTVKLSRAITK